MKHSSQLRGARLRRHRRDDESDRERLQNRAQCRALGVRHGGGRKGRAPHYYRQSPHKSHLSLIRRHRTFRYSLV